MHVRLQRQPVRVRTLHQPTSKTHVYNVERQQAPIAALTGRSETSQPRLAYRKECISLLGPAYAQCTQRFSRTASQAKCKGG